MNSYPALVAEAERYVRQQLEGEGTGHDWWHIHRVRANALALADAYPQADRQQIELAALFHDIADHKFHDGDHTVGPQRARAWLLEQGADAPLAEAVAESISSVSFSGGKEARSLEAQIVQDADRLDALGAVGIARTFAYSGSQGRPMYHPQQDQLDTSQPGAGGTVEHFHDKLLLLADRMNTPQAGQMAQQRIGYMREFLAQLQAEHDGQA